MSTNLLDALRSDDPDRFGPAFEGLILEAAELDDSALEPIAAAYAYLSGRLNQRTEGERSGLFSVPRDASFGAPHMLAAWGLVYGWRSFTLAKRYLGRGAGRVVEVGAGWGPAGLVAGLAGRPVQLVEPSPAANGFGERIYRVAGLHGERAVRNFSVGDLTEGDTVCLPFSLWELVDRRKPDEVARWLRGLVARIGEGRLLVFEAGNREAALPLQATRDLLVGHGVVAGPCFSASPCPRLAEDDWCHFTWRSRPGPLTRRVSEIAGRRWQEQHASLLFLEQVARVDGYRVLGSRKRGKAKVEAELCGPEGLVRITGLGRDRAVAELVLGLEAGSVVDLDLEQAESKGDGIRIRSAHALRLVVD